MLITSSPPPMYRAIASSNTERRAASYPPLKVKTRTQLISLITSLEAFRDRTLISRALDNYCRGKLGKNPSKERLGQKLHMVEETMYEYRDLGLPDCSAEFIRLRKSLGLQSSKIFTPARSSTFSIVKTEHAYDPLDNLPSLAKR